ncbi:MAG: hypothetical protein K6F81_00725 [Acholeplasmatales bacterium]|nr:hypothetical protein [Acholeplasmatales bacterium]
MKQELIFCIVNNGFSDMVMDAAREGGAKGGTIINARGSARAEAEKKYKVSIHDDKDIILIVADEDCKEKILHSLYQKAGLNTAAHGLTFTMPIDDSVGFNNNIMAHQDLTDQD